jgi:hypothetical protein
MSNEIMATWRPTGPISHQWPDRSVEQYSEGYQATVNLN